MFVDFQAYVTHLTNHSSTFFFAFLYIFFEFLHLDVKIKHIQIAN